MNQKAVYLSFIVSNNVSGSFHGYNPSSFFIKFKIADDENRDISMEDEEKNFEFAIVRSHRIFFEGKMKNFM